MERKKRIKHSAALSRLFIVIGCVLVFASAALALRNYNESRQAGEDAMSALPAVQEEVRRAAEKPAPEKEHVNPYDIEAEEEAEEMTVKEIDGEKYIGYLTIPDYGLELPVMSEWSYPRLRKAPCRQFGSTKTDDLVIAAHNYSSHFGQLKDMMQGDTVFFTDMDGERIEYEIDSVGVISPDDIETVKNGGYDLVLYTCTYGGANRVMVGCYRSESLTE